MEIIKNLINFKISRPNLIFALMPPVRHARHQVAVEHAQGRQRQPQRGGVDGCARFARAVEPRHVQQLVDDARTHRGLPARAFHLKERQFGRFVRTPAPLSYISRACAEEVRCLLRSVT